MGIRRRLSDRDWEVIQQFLIRDARQGAWGCNEREFIEAVFWIHRTGAAWRDLPEEFGSWRTIHGRMSRWAKKGKWDRLFEHLKQHHRPLFQALDSTTNRAHQHSAGGQKGGPWSKALGRVAGDAPRKSTSSQTRKVDLFITVLPTENSTTSELQKNCSSR